MGTFVCFFKICDIVFFVFLYISYITRTNGELAKPDECWPSLAVVAALLDSTSVVLQCRHPYAKQIWRRVSGGGGRGKGEGEIYLLGALADIRLPETVYTRHGSARPS